MEQTHCAEEHTKDCTTRFSSIHGRFKSGSLLVLAVTMFDPISLNTISVTSGLRTMRIREAGVLAGEKAGLGKYWPSGFLTKLRSAEFHSSCGRKSCLGAR